MIVEVADADLDEEQEGDVSLGFAPTVAPATPEYLPAGDLVQQTHLYPSFSVSSANEPSIFVSFPVESSMLLLSDRTKLEEIFDLSGGHVESNVVWNKVVTDAGDTSNVQMKSDIDKNQILEQLILRYNRSMEKASSKSGEVGKVADSLLSSLFITSIDSTRAEASYLHSGGIREMPSFEVSYDVSKTVSGAAIVPTKKLAVSDAFSEHVPLHEDARETQHGPAVVQPSTSVGNTGNLVHGSTSDTFQNEIDNLKKGNNGGGSHYASAQDGRRNRIENEPSNLNSVHRDGKAVGNVEFQDFAGLQPSRDDMVEQELNQELERDELSSSHGGMPETNFDAAEREDDVMLSFNEWKVQLKQKGDVPDTVSRHFGTGAAKKKSKINKNYASVECGAKIVSANPEASSRMAILNENKDDYMLSPCNAKTWFVVELCERIHIHSVDVANFEMFSSVPERFSVYITGRLQTKEWEKVGTFLAKNEREVQSFEFKERFYSKYIKIEIKSYYGQEHYCPLSLFRVFGTSEVEEIEESEENDLEAARRDSFVTAETENASNVGDESPIVKHDDSEPLPNSDNIFVSAKKAVLGLVNNVAKSLTMKSKDSLNNSDSTPVVSMVPNVNRSQEFITLVNDDYGEDVVNASWNAKCPFHGDMSSVACTNLNLHIWTEYAFRRRMCPLMPVASLPYASGIRSSIDYELKLSWENLSLQNVDVYRLTEEGKGDDKSLHLLLNATAKLVNPSLESANILTDIREGFVELRGDSQIRVASDGLKGSVSSNMISPSVQASFPSFGAKEERTTDASCTASVGHITERQAERISGGGEHIETMPHLSSPQANAANGETESVSQGKADVDIIVFDLSAGIGIKVGETKAGFSTPDIVQTGAPEKIPLRKSSFQDSHTSEAALTSAGDLPRSESKSAILSDATLLSVTPSFGSIPLEVPTHTEEALKVKLSESTLPLSHSTSFVVMTTRETIKETATVVNASPSPAASIGDPTVKPKPFDDNLTHGKASDQKSPDWDLDDADNMTVRVTGVTGSKESVIVKLNARVKALETNLTMSMTYLELMSDKYRKAVHDIDKKAESKISALNESLEFQRDVIMKQTELIAILSQQVDLLTSQLQAWQNLTSEQHEKMSERHFAWIFLEVVLIFVLVLVCRPGKRQVTDAHRRHSAPSMPFTFSNGYAVHDRSAKCSSDSDIPTASVTSWNSIDLRKAGVAGQPNSGNLYQGVDKGVRASARPPTQLSRKKRRLARRSLVMASELAAHENLMEEASRELGLSKTSGLLFHAGKGILRGITGALYRPSGSNLATKSASDSSTDADSSFWNSGTHTMKRSRSSELPAIVEVSTDAVRPTSFDDMFSERKSARVREFHRPR